jgi:nucleoside-diphosphate-sugar epimerase
MNSVLITGITGKSGSYMLKEMVAHADELRDYRFKVLVRATSNTKGIDDSGLNIEKYAGDISNKESMQEFCEGGYDTLVHITGIHWSLVIVPAALKAGVKRIVVVHTTGIYSKYKAAGEEYRQIDEEVEKICKEAGATLTILRPTMIYGNLRDGNLTVFIKMIDKLRLFPTINGAKYELQPVWCGDLGKAYYQVMMNPESTDGKQYNLSGGQPIMLLDMFKEIGRQLDVRNTFIPVPFWLAYSGAWLLYLLTLGKKKFDYRERIQRMVEPRIFRHENATRDFGYNPLNFEDGIKTEIEEYKRFKNKNQRVER